MVAIASQPVFLGGWRNRTFLSTMANGTRVLKQKSREKEACHGINTNAYNHEFADRCAPRAGKFPANEDREASKEIKMTGTSE